MAIKTKLVTNEEILQKLTELTSLLSVNDQPMKASEAAKFLGINPVTLRRYVQQGIIPSYKLEGNRLFLKSELINWVRGGNKC